MRIRWAPFEDICDELRRGSPPGTFFYVEDAAGKVVAGQAPESAKPCAAFPLGGGSRRVGRLCAAGEPADNALRMFRTCGDRELAHQITVHDMADATARLWRQTNALLRMAACTNLAFEPASVIENVIGVLDHSTGLGRGVALVRLPGQNDYSVFGIAGCESIEPRQVRRLAGIEDEVRLVTEHSVDSALMRECAVILGSETPLAVSRLSTENDDYGFLITPTRDIDTVRADDLKLLAAGAQILSVAMENSHTLSREREATRLQVENELLNTQARDMEEMLQVVAHDLRSPMTALYGFMHVALDAIGVLGERLDEEGATVLAEEGRRIAEPLESGTRSIEKLNQMVQRLLDFSRVARMDYNFEQVDLAALANDVVHGFGFQVGDAEIEVSVDELPVARGDRVSLEAVFRNLVDNAVKYMGNGERRKIRIGCREGEEALFYVKDTGVGMTPDQVAKAFLPFRRFHGDAAPGDGIGLPYVRKIIERHGGTIWCESEQGVGSTFFFTLGAAED